MLKTRESRIKPTCHKPFTNSSNKLTKKGMSSKAKSVKDQMTMNPRFRPWNWSTPKRRTHSWPTNKTTSTCQRRTRGKRSLNLRNDSDLTTKTGICKSKRTWLSQLNRNKLRCLKRSRRSITIISSLLLRSKPKSSRSSTRLQSISYPINLTTRKGIKWIKLTQLDRISETRWSN